MKINVLTEDVIGKISAGEVVERPASIVKELVENSIDAGSDSIEIEVQDAGTTLIRVADNGEGMSPEDAKTACLRHSTSKIKGIEDLDDLRTLGFRGEALASIAAVTQMDLISRAATSDQGISIQLESGEIRKSLPAGRAGGTTIEARNLFYNVPARRKFLKREATELAEIVNVVGRFIIAHPEIEFKLTQGTRCLLHATKDMNAVERIRLILGGDFADHLLDISDDSGKFKLSGYVSRPSCTRKDRKAQMFFVNGRFVRSKILNDAVYVAYKSLLERGRYPSVVLFLDVAPSDVDVNVHPTKMEVKFDNDRTVKDVVRKVISGRFGQIKQEGPDVHPAVSFSSADAATTPETPVFKEIQGTQEEFTYEPGSRRSGENISGKGPSIVFERRANEMPADTEDIFQVGGCYIVQIKKDSVVITDQHAAHERVLYECFRRISEETPAQMQNLLFPMRIDLSADEALIMERAIDGFRGLGFQIEPFGERSYVVQAVPAVLKDRDVTTVVNDILVDLAEYDLAKADLHDELVKLTSCRAAVNSGDVLTREEMAGLLGQLSACELPFTCPHGRPTVTEITLDELQKRFRRK